MEHTVELAGVGRDGDLDVGVLPEHAQGNVQPFLSPTSGVDVGDEQEGVHDRHPRGTRAAGWKHLEMSAVASVAPYDGGLRDRVTMDLRVSVATPP